AVRGLLVVSRFSGSPFTEDELSTLNLIGHAAMLSLHNAELHAQAIDSRNQADVLNRTLRAGTETALELVQQLDISDVVARLLKQAVNIAEADRAVLMSIDGDEATVLQSMARGSTSQPIEPPGVLRVSKQPLIVKALQTGAAQQSHAVDVEDLPGKYRAEMRRLQTFASVPLNLGGDTTGVLNLSRYRKERFSDEQLQALTLLGQVAALAMRNARLFEELRAASTSKTEFLNMAAHELRTPIAVLRGYLSLLIDGALGEAPPEWRQPLEVLAAKVRDLSNIAEELLLAARVQSGSIGGKPVRFDLVDAVRSAIDSATPAAALAGGWIRSEPGLVAAEVNADPLQIRRVLDNLLVNAITYSTHPPEVTVWVRRKARSAVVSVADRGRGIPEDRWEAVFDQFVRVEDQNDMLRPGTGLGLYVSRGFARANGGDVRLVRSVLGAGSEFELELPLAGK
ncbi:MAG TPA: GAF domain-containing sensor histidine kinase, partial [Candidatus Udaeobacter sp.]|nr:GAF domain-containing sensor histidine kinase [Candidatus Udaeobacter sp.]